MQRYVVGRLLQAALALLGVAATAFLLVSLSGDPAYILLTPEAGEEQRTAFRRLYGLDEPLPVQYVRYVGHVLQGDFGTSFAQGRPALTVVLERVPAEVPESLPAAASSIVPFMAGKMLPWRFVGFADA